MLKKIIKKSFLYKPLKAILKRIRKIKKNYLERKKQKESMITYEQAEAIISSRYKDRFGKELNWDNPKTFCEKMNFTKLYNPTKTKQLLTDKITVRDWIKKVWGEEHLIPLIAVYDKFEDIDFSKLPKEYVIKCNHDSGSTTIVDKNHPLNKEELQKNFRYFMKRNLSSFNYEMHYRNIVPKIMIEKKLGNDLKDYKFFCFDGEVKFFKIDFDRFTNHGANYFTKERKLLPFGEKLFPPNHSKKLTMPKTLDEMLEVAEKLSKGFDFVRVDLYEHKNQVYFGEMTFTAGNGMSPFAPEEYELEIGSYWNLNTDKRKKLLKKKLKVDRDNNKK